MAYTPTTSGTVATQQWSVRHIADHAFRRAGLAAEMVSAENLSIAMECINGVLAEWTAAGFPLWTRQYLLLSPPVGSPDVPTPTGTTDILNAFWRQFMPYRGPATTSNSTDASVLFAGAPNADLTITGTNPGVTVAFGQATEIDTIGVLWGDSVSVTTALQVFTSTDGVAYTLSQTLPSATYTPGTWTYFDLNPAVIQPYVKLVYPGTNPWVVNQILFGLVNWTDTPLGIMNMDDYYNLPDRYQSASRAVNYFVDRQLNYPVIKIWDVLNQVGFYAGTVTTLCKRYIMDAGAMANLIEVPPRAIEALIWRLASMLIYEIQDTSAQQATSAGYMGMMLIQAKQQRLTNIEMKAAKAEAIFFAEERSHGPIVLVPNISAYTR